MGSYRTDLALLAVAVLVVALSAAVPAQELPLFLEPAPLHQRLINRQVSPRGVLDKERRFRDVIEKLLDDDQLRGKGRRRAAAGLGVR